MYYIQKHGIYPQGVFWIGRDVLVGKRKLDKLADADKDSYHNWELIKYEECKESDCWWDSIGKCVYKRTKTEILQELNKE